MSNIDELRQGFETAYIITHEAARWLDKESLNSVQWLPADITLIEKVRQGM